MEPSCTVVAHHSAAHLPHLKKLWLCGSWHATQCASPKDPWASTNEEGAMPASRSRVSMFCDNNTGERVVEVRGLPKIFRTIDVSVEVKVAKLADMMLNKDLVSIHS